MFITLSRFGLHNCKIPDTLFLSESFKFVILSLNIFGDGEGVLIKFPDFILFFILSKDKTLFKLDVELMSTGSFLFFLYSLSSSSSSSSLLVSEPIDFLISFKRSTSIFSPFNSFISSFLLFLFISTDSSNLISLLMLVYIS